MKGESGTATAEFAIALPAVMSVMLILLGGFSVQLQKLDLTEKAAIASRAVARGEGLDLVESWFDSATSIDITENGEMLCAQVHRSVQLFGLPEGLVQIAASHCARKAGL